MFHAEEYVSWYVINELLFFQYLPLHSEIVRQLNDAAQWKMPIHNSYQIGISVHLILAEHERRHAAELNSFLCIPACRIGSFQPKETSYHVLRYLLLPAPCFHPGFPRKTHSFLLQETWWIYEEICDVASIHSNYSSSLLPYKVTCPLRKMYLVN